MCDLGIFPLLRYKPAPPYGDRNGMELFQYTAVTIAILLIGEFEQFNRELIGSISLSVRHALGDFLHLKDRR